MKKTLSFLLMLLFALSSVPQASAKEPAKPNEFNILATRAELGCFSSDNAVAQGEKPDGTVDIIPVVIDSVIYNEATQEYNVEMHSDIYESVTSLPAPVTSMGTGTSSGEERDNGLVVRAKLSGTYIKGTNSEDYTNYLLTKFSGSWEILDGSFTLSERKIQYGCFELTDHSQWVQKNLGSVNEFSYTTNFTSAKSIISNSVEVGGRSIVRIKRGTSAGYLFDFKLIIYRSSKIFAQMLNDTWVER